MLNVKVPGTALCGMFRNVQALGIRATVTMRAGGDGKYRYV